MKVFSCKFYGYWPVGACAIIVARNEVQAHSAMTTKLAAMGLLEDNAELKLEEVDPSVAGVHILLDGQY